VVPAVAESAADKDFDMLADFVADMDQYSLLVDMLAVVPPEARNEEQTVVPHKGVQDIAHKDYSCYPYFFPSV
jgi:predicted secreted protein